jgi:hypothetical protein
VAGNRDQRLAFVSSEKLGFSALFELNDKPLQVGREIDEFKMFRVFRNSMLEGLRVLFPSSSSLRRG